MSSLNIVKNGTAILISINRPEALNALNKSVFDELFTFFNETYENYEPFSGVIITGSGEKAFAAGADIKEFLELDGEGMTNLSRRGQSVFFLIERFHKVVIAAVNGFSLGGGCELAMACHMRIGSEKAKFGQPEVNLGIIPGYGATQRLVQLVGKAKAMELILTARIIKADEALELGLINQMTSVEELISTCEAMIETIGQKGPLAIANSIQAINGFYNSTSDGFDDEAKLFGRTADSSDFKEGIQAFIEKRKANFKGE